MGEQEHGNKGGNPLLAQMEAPWANSRFFIIDIVALLLLAAFVGILSFGYSFIVSDLLEKWLSAAADLVYPDKYPDAYLEDTDLFGCVLWIPFCWAGGTAVGVLKWAVGLETFASFLDEIRDQHCDSIAGLKTMLCCMASLFSGAAVGPEAGLAAMGGGVGTFFARIVASIGPAYAHEEKADARRRLYVLAGIVAAFGTLFPAPWLALLIVVECSLLKVDAEGTMLSMFGRRTLFLLGITATSAFMVRYAVKEIPNLPDFAHAARQAGETYDNLMPIKAVLLGVIASFAALFFLITGALFKSVFTRIGLALERCCGKPARIIGLCSLAGLLTGVLGYLVPLSLTSGKESMFPTLLHSKELSIPALLWIALAKTASHSVAAAGGMVGGPFFPILYIGVVVGEICARIPINWGVIPSALTVPVFMVALPSAVFPVPFTMVALPLSYFHLGPLWCVNILAGILTSYTLLIGTGLVKKLAGS